MIRFHNMKTNNNIPQGYKNSPLGIIPQEWEVKKLGDVAESFSGGTPKAGNNEYYGGNIPFIRSGEIHQKNTALFLSELGLAESSAKIVEKGDLLIALYGANSGDSAISQINGAINQAILCIRPYNLLTSFLCSFLELKKNMYVAKYLQGGQGNLSGDIVNNYIIPIPPLPEQQKIAEVLGTWDKAIEKQTQLIEKLELRKKGLMKQLLTEKKRLPGFSGEWKRVKAGLLFGSSSIRSNKLEPLLSVTQDKGVVPRDMLETRVTMPDGDLSSFKLVDVGDFVISLRSFEGGLEYSKYRGIVSPAYTVLKKKTDISDVFYKVYFKSNDFIQRLAVAVIGIRDGKQISYSDFCYIKIPYPSLQEQNAIIAVRRNFTTA
ncbi:EcoKI restriction-modification system protein HsdS [uncultured Bacteroides sp.]|nr:EcoKI restriction-modification system protein HsdS [uncultured Bacteroides sp.]